MNGRESGSRLFIGGGVVAAVILAALTWFVVISPIRADAQSLRDDTASVQDQNGVLEAETAQLSQQAEDRATLVADARAALSALPPGTQLPGFNRQLARQARSRGVAVTSLSIGASTTPTPAADGAATGATQAIPVTILSTGPLLSQLFFLQDLQQVGPRRALVSSVSLSAGEGAASVEPASVMTIQLTVFTAPLADTVRTQLATILHPDGSN